MKIRLFLVNIITVDNLLVKFRAIFLGTIIYIYI